MKGYKKYTLLVIAGLTSFVIQEPVLAFGGTATEIIKELSRNHVNRYSGSEQEEVTGEYIESLFNSYGLETSVQPFTYELDNGEVFDSQNIISEKVGTSGLEIILGAHYDSRPSSETVDRTLLQGTNDNASGMGLLMELAESVNSLDTIHTIKFIAFGSEEVGLKGSRFYADNLSQEEANNTLFMANFDSIVFGDYMYFHAGLPAAYRPEWGFARDLALEVAEDLDIEVLTNPGLNLEYPAGTGCCSDQVAFEEIMPVLSAEATNWFIGEQDGYTQTTDPRVPGGATWHDPVYDSLEFIEGNFPGLIEERTSNYSEIMQTVLLETNDITVPVQQVPEPMTVFSSLLAGKVMLKLRVANKKVRR